MKIKIATSILALSLIFAPINGNILAEAEKSVEYKEPSYIDEVTVSIGKVAGSIELTGTYSIAGVPGLVLKPGKYNIKSSTNTVSIESNGVSIYKSDSVKLFPINYNLDNSIKIGKNSYLGSISFERNRAINKLPMEHYLYGVVPNEIGANVHIEAQKAQAVSARSYAANKSGKVMVSNTTDQVYYGFNKSNVKSVEAVNSTQGQVMKSNGKVVSTYYSSSNGGFTNSAKNIWAGQNNSYLTRKIDKYDENYKWEVKLSKYQMKDLALGNEYSSAKWDSLIEKDKGAKNFDGLKSFMIGKSYKVNGKQAVIPNLNNFKVSEIKNVAFTKSDVAKDGDVLTGNLEIKIAVRDSVTGKVEVGTFSHRLNAYKFYTEKVFGALDSRNLDTMHSANIKDVVDDGNNFIIKGSGYGHGVGMSQKGAIARAEAGMNFKEILSFYYTGTDLTNLKVGPVSENKNPVELQGNEVLHKVVEEDTLYSISKKYDVSVNQIKVWNNIDSSNLIKLGSSLVVGYKEVVVPEKEQHDVHVVKRGDTLYSISLINKISVNELKTMNGLKNNVISVGQKLLVKVSPEKPDKPVPVKPTPKPVESNQYYIVKRGDTLYSISMNNKISVEELKKMNGLENNVISVGQKLIVKVQSNEAKPQKPVSPGPVKPVPDKGTEKSHIVIKSDTLYALSKKYKVSVSELKKLNKLKTETLFIGQRLKVVEASTQKPSVSYRSHKVASGDTLYRIAIKYNMTVDELVSINNLASKSSILRLNQILKVK